MKKNALQALGLFFIMLIFLQPVNAAYRSAVITSTPELETITIDGNKVSVLKGTKEPYTGTTSITNSARYDVVAKQDYVDGVTDDIKIYYHSSGVKIKGELMFPYSDGSKHMIVKLIRGMQHGDTKSWYPSGILSSKVSYNMGVRVGNYETYYKSGNKKQAGIDGVDGAVEWADWYDGGAKENYYKFNSANIGPVVAKHWDPKGSKHGLWIDKYDDGSIHKQKQYAHGWPSGMWKVWHENGKQNIEMEFMRGLLNGPFKFWNEKGVLVVDGKFKGSKEIGRWSFKDNDGNSIRRPKDLDISITDEGEPITVIGHDNKEIKPMEYYVSIYMPLAIALFILLLLLGIGIRLLYEGKSKK